MKIGIISDTHDNLPNIQKSVQVFNKEKVEMVLHLGDWCSPFAPDFFAGLKCQIKSVFGNNDADIFAFLKKKFSVDIEFRKRIFEIDLAGKKAVMFHGDDAQITNSLIQSGAYDVVFTGHTHIVVNEMKGKTLHINPGTVSHYKSGKINREFTIAIYDSEKNSAKILKI